MARQESRPKRWAKATSAAEDALGALEAAISEIEDLKSEYEDWRDNLPESLQNSALADKLNTICDLELQSAFDELQSVLKEAVNAELPMGFGRD